MTDQGYLAIGRDLHTKVAEYFQLSGRIVEIHILEGDFSRVDISLDQTRINQHKSESEAREPSVGDD